MLLTTSIYLAFIIVFINAFAFSEERRHSRDINRFDHLNLKSEKIIREIDLVGYPELLKKYLIHAGVVDKQMINQIRIYSKGKSKIVRHTKWSIFTCSEYYFYNIESYIEEISIRVWFLIRIKIINKYKHGSLEKLVLFLSSISTERINGKYEENHNGLVRYFRHMIFSPSTLMDENITWTQIGSNVLIGEYDMRGYKLKAYISVNDAYQITNFVTWKFYRDKDRYKKALWSSHFDGYREFNGYVVPTECKMQWHFDEGNIVEKDAKIINVEYR
jgi:hypothetical protein